MTDWRPTASISTLEVRATMLRAAREYFVATRAVEVETPTLARAAVSDIHLQSIEARAVGQRRFLPTSPEYWRTWGWRGSSCTAARANRVSVAR